MMNLYQLNDALQQIQDAANDGATPDEVMAALESVEMDFKDKAQNVAYMIRNLISNIDSLEAEESRLADRRKSAERQAERLKEYLIVNMRAAGISKVDDGKLRASLVKPKPVVVITDEDEVPVDFVNVKTSAVIDKRALLEALKALPDGDKIPGAEIGESKTGLTIS